MQAVNWSIVPTINQHAAGQKAKQADMQMRPKQRHAKSPKELKFCYMHCLMVRHASNALAGKSV